MIEFVIFSLVIGGRLTPAPLLFLYQRVDATARHAEAPPRGDGEMLATHRVLLMVMMVMVGRLAARVIALHTAAVRTAPR